MSEGKGMRNVSKLLSLVKLSCKMVHFLQPKTLQLMET
jgi:hypothetical protein